jgi:tetratricopeptide (TPR) repeat protein
MNRLTLIPWLATSISFLFVSGCAVPKFEPSVVSTRRSVFRGEIKEALASYEAQAQQSEKNAAAANYPEKYWGSAVRNYAEASRAARLSGQLQKAITYAGKALEIADKVKDPSLRLAAIEMLILAYRSVGNFDKARDLIEKGLQINNEIPANSATRRIWEANLKEKMGLELSRRGNYEKAAEALSESIYLTRGRESLISSSCRLIGAPAGCQTGSKV